KRYNLLLFGLIFSCWTDGLVSNSTLLESGSCCYEDGYWELTVELGKLINVNVDAFANVFLKNKGIHSLGERIRRLVATLLVLQLMREEELEEGKLLSERWQQVKKAVDWVRWADREYPCACSRLEFGWSWESSTRQLLGFERFPPFSPLITKPQWPFP
uniref:PARP4 MVP-ID C-terminal domain-containing protein n=1 Tax=Xiphophorus maculatus TaxID=8083 RepID=A0A3B5R3E0_XIPMA